MQDNFREEIQCLEKYYQSIANVNNEATAATALGEAEGFNKTLKDLAIEKVFAEKLETEANRKTFLDGSKEDEDKNFVQLITKANELKAIAGAPSVPKLGKAIQDGVNDFKQTVNDGRAAPAEKFKLLPTKVVEAPFYASLLIWGLILLILAVCTGFLYNDGLWSNAVRLVNVIFAGLLAMNFFEPVANWAIGLTAYVSNIRSFAPFLDFLALWVVSHSFWRSSWRSRTRFQGPRPLPEDRRSDRRRGGCVLDRLGDGRLHLCLAAYGAAQSILPLRRLRAAEQHGLRPFLARPRVARIHQTDVRRALQSRGQPRGPGSMQVPQ